MSQGVAINGKRLDQVHMPLKSWSDRVVSYRSYPKSQFKISLEGGILQLGFHLPWAWSCIVRECCRRICKPPWLSL